MKYLKAIWIAICVGLRRLFHGPKRPSWSWHYEYFVAMLRAEFGRPMDGRLQEVREMMDQIGHKLLRKDVARFAPKEIARIPCVWVETTGDSGNGVLLYLHGGAYVAGSIESHKPIMVELAHSTGFRVLGINYRLAPEDPCPAAIDDTVAVYLALLEQGQDPGQIIFVGDSAGGGLVVTTLMALRERQLPLPAGAVLISPWTDLTVSGATLEENAEYDIIQKKAILELACPKYYTRDLDPLDPRVSPVFGDLQGLPPLLVFVGGAEVLLDDSRRLDARAKLAGVEVELHVEPDEVHDYPIFIGYSRAIPAFLQRTSEFVRGSSVLKCKPQPIRAFPRPAAVLS